MTCGSTVGFLDEARVNRLRYLVGTPRVVDPLDRHGVGDQGRKSRCSPVSRRGRRRRTP